MKSGDIVSYDTIYRSAKPKTIDITQGTDSAFEQISEMGINTDEPVIVKE